MERYTFHVYLLGGMIHRYVYDGAGTVAYSCDTEIEPGAVIPNKRAYPERCDYSFMRAVHSMGELVSYAKFDTDITLVDGPHFYGNIA